MGKKIECNWFENDTYPFHYSIATNKNEFNQLQKNLFGKILNKWDKSTSGRLYHFINNGKSAYIVGLIITDKISFHQILGLLVHEVTHIIQNVWIDIGEEKPGKECEAYLLQSIFQCLMNELYPNAKPE